MNISRDGHASSSSSASGENDLLFIGFNQDSGCFACGTTSGFVIYNVEPFRETFRRTFTSGGIGIVEMLFRCNLIAIVGGGRNPRYPTNKVMIWDDNQNKCIGELMFKNEVFAVKLRRDRVVVVLSTKVFVYRFSDLKLVDQISTVSNSRGLISLCPDPSNNVLAIPGLSRGLIRVELYDISKATFIKAHDADLAHLALNADGSRLATASEKGTLIRLWDCHTGDLLREFRRGMDRANIFCVCFNLQNTFLACSSDKGTVHIFSLAERSTSRREEGYTESPSKGRKSPHTASNPNPNPNTPDPHTFAGYSEREREREAEGTTVPPSSAVSTTNKSLGLNFLRGIVPKGLMPKYLDSEWSYAQVRGLEGRFICAFDKDSNRIVVVCADGTFISSSFEEPGDCPRLHTIRFLKSKDDTDNGFGDEEG